MNAKFVGALATSFFFFHLTAAAQAPPPPTPSQAPGPETVTVEKVFHIAGIPGVSRNTRLTLVLTDREFIFRKGKKETFRLPYERVQRGQLMSGERHYPEATYAAAVATPFGVGALLILKKRQMDTLVLDFLSERGGKMGMVIQLPKGQGAVCKEGLGRHGLNLEEPAPAPAKTEEKKPG